MQLSVRGASNKFMNTLTMYMYIHVLYTKIALKIKNLAKGGLDGTGDVLHAPSFDYLIYIPTVKFNG